MSDNGWRKVLDSPYEIKINDKMHEGTEFEGVRIYDTISESSMYLLIDTFKPAPKALKVLYGISEDEECYIYS